MNMGSRGLLIVVSGPSGVGKGTVCEELRRRMPDIAYSVSATTRQPRKGEVDGVDYYFRTKEEFERMIEQDELLEWTQYVGNYYGTPARFVRETLEKGTDILLEIEVQGALTVKRKFPEGVYIFLMPPSLEELQNRIEKRGTETSRTIQDRMTVAREEILSMQNYDYAVVNDDIDAACERIRAIIMAEKCRTKRMLPHFMNWFEEVK